MGVENEKLAGDMFPDDEFDFCSSLGSIASDSSF